MSQVARTHTNKPLLAHRNLVTCISEPTCAAGLWNNARPATSLLQLWSEGLLCDYTNSHLTICLLEIQVILPKGRSSSREHLPPMNSTKYRIISTNPASKEELWCESSQRLTRAPIYTVVNQTVLKSLEYLSASIATGCCWIQIFNNIVDLNTEGLILILSTQNQNNSNV